MMRFISLFAAVGVVTLSLKVIPIIWAIDRLDGGMTAIIFSMAIVALVGLVFEDEAE